MQYCLKIEDFGRTRIFSHEFSNLLLQIVFRWGDAGTSDVMWLPAINIERIKRGEVTFKWDIRKTFTGTGSLEQFHSVDTL